jgi:hypothetical protein
MNQTSEFRDYGELNETTKVRITFWLSINKF